MLLSSPWIPRLAEEKGPPSDRLVAALAADIATGAVPAGSRLPAHRDLAYKLGIGLGTVTKAYAVLERRGLTQSVRGRGTFVSGLPPRPIDIVDLSVNVPPQMLSDRLLAASLSGLAKRLDAGAFADYAPPAGRPAHRRLMALWLRSQGLAIPPEQVILCNGAQHALAIALAVACPEGGTIMTEAMTYPGALLLARQRGLPVIGLDMDAEGILPDALERTLGRPRSEGNPRVLYVTPTIQNPTTATMGFQRRLDIVQICRAHGVTIIEDDVHSIFGDRAIPPLAMLAPERTLYVSGLSKALSPGLRIGALALPVDRVAPALSELQASCTMASPLSCLIMEQWLTDGTASSVASSIRLEAGIRIALALKCLPGPTSSSVAGGFHIWLPMPSAQAVAIASEAAKAGIIILPPETVMVDRTAALSGLRLSLGGQPAQALKLALTRLSDLIGGGGELPRGLDAAR